MQAGKTQQSTAAQYKSRVLVDWTQAAVVNTKSQFTRSRHTNTKTYNILIHIKTGGQYSKVGTATRYGPGFMTHAQLQSYFAEFLLELEIFQTKLVEKIKTQFYVQ
jgi:hypothetical protein